MSYRRRRIKGRIVRREITIVIFISCSHVVLRTKRRRSILPRQTRGRRIGSSVRSVGLKRIWRIELTRLAVSWREHVGIVFLWNKSTVVRHIRPIAVGVDRRALLMRRLSSVLFRLFETISIPLSPSIVVPLPKALIAIVALIKLISST